MFYAHVFENILIKSINGPHTFWYCIWPWLWGPKYLFYPFLRLFEALNHSHYVASIPISPKNHPSFPKFSSTSSTSSHFFLVSYPWWLPPLPLLQAPPWRPGFCTAPRSSTVAQRRTRRPCAAAAHRAKLGAWRNASRGASRAPRSRSLGKWWEKDGEIYGEREIYGEKSGEDSGMKYMDMIISNYYFCSRGFEHKSHFLKQNMGEGCGLELRFDLKWSFKWIYIMNFMVWIARENCHAMAIQVSNCFPLIWISWNRFEHGGLLRGPWGWKQPSNGRYRWATEPGDFWEVFTQGRTWI